MGPPRQNRRGVEPRLTENYRKKERIKQKENRLKGEEKQSIAT